MRRKKGFLKTLSALSLSVLFVGAILNTQTIYAFGKDTITISELDEYKNDIKDFEIETSLHNGDTFETIRVDLISSLKTLATGTVPNDELIWEFRDAPLYIDRHTKASAKRYLSMSLRRLGLLDPDWLSFRLGEVGLFNLYSLEYKMKTRSFRTANGRMYRCAIVGVSVKSWCSPYGDVCSREEALEYYNQCQEQIDLIVSKVITARQPNGEFLTNEQKLKMVHDWLITNTDYADTKLKLYRTASGKYEFGHLWNEYGAIVDGEAVCKGYACAFKTIVDKLVRQTDDDIECERATNGIHSWNRVKLNSEWYNIDTTADDASSGVTSDFFLISDHTFATLWDKGEGWADYCSVNDSAKATSSKYEGMDWEVYN